MVAIPREIKRQVLDSPEECYYFLTGRCTGKKGKRCDVDLEIDHALPRSKGGDNSSQNLHRICKSYNRSKSSNLDPVCLDESGFWDYFDDISFANTYSKMRIPQKKVIDELKNQFEFFVNNYDNLKKHALLNVLKVGTGKTLIMVLFMMSLNYFMKKHHQGKLRPNKRGLILVPERAIAQQMKNELTGFRKGTVKKSSELKDIFGINVTPRVLLVEESGQEYVPSIVKNYDLVIGCQQGLWRLSEDELQRLFYAFDWIAFDECHFATEKIRLIVSNAYGCLKLFWTATPFDGNFKFFSEVNGGEFAEFYKLFATAVDVKKDKSHKKLTSLFLKDYLEQALSYRDNKDLVPTNELKKYLDPNYVCLNGGDSLLQKGKEQLEDFDTNIRANKIRLLMLIEKAKSMLTTNGHAMFVVSSINKANSVGKIINDYAEECNQPEFGCVISHGSSKKECGLANPFNPFNVARYNGGYLKPESKRFIVVDEMGKVGYNNPLVELLVFVDIELSCISISQRLGRAIRWNESINRASQLFMFKIPDDEVGSVKVLWDSASDPEQKFLWRLYDAIEYMNNMEEWATQKFDNWQTIDPKYNGIPIVKEIDVVPLPPKERNKLKEKTAQVIEYLPEADNDTVVNGVMEGEDLINGKKEWTEKWLKEQVVPSIRKGIEEEKQTPSGYPDFTEQLKELKQDDNYDPLDHESHFTKFNLPSLPKDKSVDHESLTNGESNKYWSIPELVEPSSYCIKEDKSLPSLNELKDYVVSIGNIDNITKDFILEQITQNNQGIVEHYVNQYMAQKAVFDSSLNFGFEPTQLLGTVKLEELPIELKNTNIMSLLHKELIEAFSATLPSSALNGKTVGYFFVVEMRMCLWTAGAVAFGLSAFGKKDPIFKQKSSEIAYAIFADTRKENVANKIMKMAKALFVKRMYVRYGALAGNYFANKNQIDWIVDVVESRYGALRNGKK